MSSRSMAAAATRANGSEPGHSRRNTVGGAYASSGRPAGQVRTLQQETAGALRIDRNRVQLWSECALQPRQRVTEDGGVQLEHRQPATVSGVQSGCVARALSS